MMTRWFLGLMLMAVVQHPAFGAELTPDKINGANFTGKLPSEDSISPLAVKVQVLLDRARFSPGEIDGRFGDNVEKALQAFAEANSLASGKVLTPEIWSKLQQASSDAVDRRIRSDRARHQGPVHRKASGQNGGHEVAQGIELTPDRRKP